MSDKFALGPNIVASIEDGELTLVVNLKHTVGPSKSGKTTIIATSSGNQPLPGGAVIGLNVYRKR